jgi:iron complex outermembrane receptor protein
MTRRALACGGGLLTAVMVVPTAFAQDQTTSNPVLETITVTAQKREERLQDVPLAVTALTAGSLAESHQLQLKDYYASVPGLNVNSIGNGQTSISIRGINTGGTTNSTVGVTIDDVPYGSSSVLGYASLTIPDIDPSDLSHIEVLRGPQGTLYGASSLGGLVKFVTKEPSVEAFSGHAQFDMTQVEKGELGYGVRAGVNIPLSDTVALRASGFYRLDAGFVDNIGVKEDANDTDVYGLRASLLWRPSDAFSIKFNAHSQRTEGNDTAQVDADWRLHPTRGDLKHQRLPGSGWYDIKSDQFSAVVNASFAGLDLVSVTAYGVTEYSGVIDSANFAAAANAYFGVSGAGLLNDFETKKFTQELRLSSTGERFDWLVGGFYTDEDTPADQQVLAIDPATGATAGLILESYFPTTFEELAFFANFTVHVTDRFDIQFGGRYSDIRQTYREVDTGALFGPDPLITTTPAFNSDATTFVVSPSFKISDDLMIYARVASGYRAGGPNPGAPLGLPISYEPDETINYEIGAKGMLFDGILSFDAAVYYIDWTDIQLQLRDPATNFAYFSNAGEAKSEGLEITLQARPTDGLSIASTLAWNSAELSEPLPAGGPVADKGDRLPYSAPFTGSLSVDQDFPMAGDLTAFVGASLSHVGKRRADFVTAGNLRTELPEYTTWNVRGGVRADTWTFNVFINNVNDTRGILDGRPLIQGRQTAADAFVVNYVTPRTYGMSFSKSF